MRVFKGSQAVFLGVSGSDLALLAALFEDPFASYAELGRQLGMTGQGARKRVMRLEEEGVLRGFVATPVPAVFDREGLFFTIQDANLAPTDALGLPDVVMAGATVDDLFTFAGFVEAGMEATRRRQWVDALSVEEPLYEGGYRDDVDPGVLGPLDWRVMRALLARPRASLTELSERTGLTRRTVRDRRAGLLEAGAVEVTPLLGPSKTGRVIFHLAVIGYQGGVDALPSRLPGTVLSEQVGPVAGMGEAAILFCQAESLADQHALVQKARELPGVDAVHPYLLLQYEVHEERLTGWIQDALDAWEQTR